VPMLCAIERLARDYTGWDEVMPGPKAGGNTVTPATLALGRRGKRLARRRGFTSGHKDQHVMTFGEYICMYLAVFGSLPVEMPGYETVLNRIPLRTRKHGRRRIREPVIGRESYESDRARVGGFLDHAWKLRRVMANVPTYMMFDDHEVSDDWNLTRNNRDGLREPGTLGRRLQANALAAYWACQGFGNDPARFDDDFRRTLSDFLTAKRVDGGERFESGLLAESWSYRIEGYPLTFVLDTRTQRAYPSGEKFSSLMSPARIRELGEQIEAANDRYSSDGDGQSLLVVTAAPMLGFRAVERLQLGASFLPNRVDGEPWIGSEAAYEQLKRALARTRCRECCVLSGDVHYAYARKLDLVNRDGQPLAVFQLTSSASHNAPGGARRFFIRLFENKDLRKFNRKHTPYLFPVGLEGEHFVAGENNVGVLELEDGRPVKSVLYFNDSSASGGFTWRYRLDRPSIVNFS
jgi:hypothetical protein